jgi:hypothetical protein
MDGLLQSPRMVSSTFVLEDGFMTFSFSTWLMRDGGIARIDTNLISWQYNRSCDELFTIAFAFSSAQVPFCMFGGDNGLKRRKMWRV